MLENLHWFGQSCFRLDLAKVVYFDPYLLPGDSPKADIVFISHEHFDHYSMEDIKLICSADTAFVTDRSVGRKLQAASLACGQIKPLAPGESTTIGHVKVEAVPSYNINKEFHPQDSKKVGFIVLIEDMRIYHAGDTDFIPEMKNFHCDIALLPIGGTYVMSVEEAAQAALAIKPKVAIPMHCRYGSTANSDAARFQDLLKGKIEVKILQREGQ